MNPAVQLATAALTTWASVYAVVSGVAVCRSARARRPLGIPSEPSPDQHPRILMVRPCTGDDPQLATALESAIHMPGRAPLRMVLTVSDAADPAWPIVLRSAARLRDAGLDVQARVVTSTAFNRKVGQLEGATRDCDADIVLCIDADVDLTTFDPDLLVAPLVAPGSMLGAVWAPPIEVAPPQTWGDRASAGVLGASLHAFALLGELDGSGLVGKTFAIRSDALRDVGGFAAVARYLGEDMELARRLRARGWQTQMQRRAVHSIAENRPLRAVLDRYARWLWVIRAQRPALLLSYPLLLAAAPLLLLATAVLAGFAPGWAAGIATVVVTTRAAVAYGASRPRRATRPRWVLESLLADGVLLWAFVRALGRAEVSWRSKRLRLDRHGRLSAIT